MREREQEPIAVDEQALDDLALEALAEAHAVPPPLALRGTILAVAAAEGRVQALVRARRRWRAVGAIAATLAVVLGGMLGRTTQRLGTVAGQLGALSRDFAALKGQLATEQRRVVALEAAADAHGQFLRVLDGVQLRSASLAATAGRGGRARVLVDAESGEAAVVLADLPVLDPGKTYELWAIRGTQAPEPAGLFTVSATGGAALRVAPIEAPGQVTAFAVSIEPAGGSPQPTGPVVLVGAVG
jgi:anti-sigma-K factor RskA